MNSQLLSLLIIVDDWEALDIYENAIAPHFELTAFPMAKEGLEWATQHRPDRILLDLTFPDVTPQEALTSLKSSELTRKIPVLVIGETTESCPDADLALPRPFEMSELHLKIRDLDCLESPGKADKLEK